MDNHNRFYKINNPRDRQHLYIYINLDDISSVQYPNESLNLGIVTTKTGKEIYIQKDELDNIIKLLNVVDINNAMFFGKPTKALTSNELVDSIKSQSEFNFSRLVLNDFENNE